MNTPSIIIIDIPLLLFEGFKKKDPQLNHPFFLQIKKHNDKAKSKKDFFKHIFQQPKGHSSNF